MCKFGIKPTALAVSDISEWGNSCLAVSACSCPYCIWTSESPQDIEYEQTACYNVGNYLCE